MPKKIFMGGICGMGMAPLALFMREGGCEISGFDDNPSGIVKDILANAKVDIVKNRMPENSVDEFIITSALKRSADILKKANADAFLRRGEALANIAKTRRLIGVCGSHGKTTTTTLIAHAILKKNLDAGFVTGAIPVEMPPAKYCESAKILAAELDESDGTIENFSPEITVALNGDLDHTDTYADFSALESMFKRLFLRTKKFVIIPNNDEVLKRACADIKAQVIEIEVPQNDFLEYDKRMALAALNTAFNENFGLEIFDDFKGVLRRQEILVSNEKVFALADYAHHPREVRAFLEWLDANFSGKKLLFFQPHRYTRTKRFSQDFKDILNRRAKLGDEVFVLPVYAASEIFDESASSKLLASENVKLAEFAEMGNILEAFKKASESKICAAFIGAGDIYFEAKKLFKL